jgi:hypothetical protein
MDARKNAISMLAQTWFSSRALHGMSQKDMLGMLRSIDIEFEDTPGFFKNGTYGRRVSSERYMTEAELSRIPADRHPSGPVMRTEVQTLSNVRLLCVDNRIEFVFDGAEPVEKSNSGEKS